jgi:uncharacterized protein (TIRG00374 family)
MLRAAKLLLLLLGIAAGICLLVVYSRDVLSALNRVGWGLVPFLIASFTVYALDALGWRYAFPPEHRTAPFGRLFSIRMAGEALNKITPLASMGGEPLKAYLLTRAGTDLKDALASVAVAKNIMTLAQIAFIFCGVGMAISILPAKTPVLLGFAIFPGAVLSAMIVTAVLDHRLRRGRKQSPVPVESRRPSRIQGLVELWARVADFFWAHPREFILSFLFFFLGWAAGALELLAASHALGFRLSVRDALIMEALLDGVTMATFFIPANAGSQEGGFAYLASLLGLAVPDGIALAVLRRCRDLVWVAYGLAYLAITEGRILVTPRLEPSEGG